MGIIQGMNSKAGIKKITNEDLPFSPSQPVINSYYATSTAAQAIINLPFSVDTTTQAGMDVFWLFVDGKKLDQGASNDYVFTSIASDGTSTQVTLNNAIPINLNIQAYKLGLKAEVEFQTDNRFVQIYAANEAGYQSFINSSTVVVPTTTTGSPVAGSFYSSISGRAPIIDLSQDLKARLGIDRMIFQQLQLVANELGPNGEQVFAIPNDQYGQVRLAGAWTTIVDSSGPRVVANLTSAFAAGDFLEVTFYGTGLNLLLYTDATARPCNYSVDGGSTTLVSNTSGATEIGGRGASANVVTPVINNLALGVHTVKITTTSTTPIGVYGVEILNESSTIRVNPGIGFVDGKKYVSSAQASFAPSTGVTGVRGGRTVVYQNGDGSIGQAFQATNAARQDMALADHSNEELVGVHYFREFGCGRTTNDDFSLPTNPAGTFNLAFTLDDGTTTLAGSSLAITIGAGYAYVAPNANGANLILTFVGTGLDVLIAGGGGPTFDAHSVILDGVTTLSTTLAGNGSNRVVKIVSGLPYGTHTIKITRTAVAGFGLGVISYNIYGPKKPVLPVGVVEIADYNVMATYVANTSPAVTTVGTGLLRKMAVRENYYSGTWVTPSINATNFNAGWDVHTATSASFYQYTFFGTGVEMGFFVSNAGATNLTILVDGVNLTGVAATLLQPGTGLTLSGAGVITGTSSAINNARVNISGLALGLHTIKVTTGNTTNAWIDCFDVICPIHSVRNNIYSDLQNTLPVGSQSISDNRAITPVKDALDSTKAWAQAIGFLSSPTTSSTSYSPLADMSVAIKTTGGDLDISYFFPFSNSVGASPMVQVGIFVDGTQVGPNNVSGNTTANQILFISGRFIVPVAAGYHKVELYWLAPAGTVTAVTTVRVLTAKEI